VSLPLSRLLHTTTRYQHARTTEFSQDVRKKISRDELVHICVDMPKEKIDTQSIIMQLQALIQSLAHPLISF
jgi:hypothetical protein